MTVMEVRRRLFSSVSVLASLTACTVFSGSDPDGTSPQDAGTTSDATVTEAAADGAPSGPDAGSQPRFPGTSFCADAGNAIFCDDFDEPGRDAGWKALVADGGSIAVAPTFASGSAPSALLATLSDAGGSAYLASIGVPVGAKGVSVDFDYYAPPGPQSATLVRAGFAGDPNVLTLYALSGTKIGCLEFPADAPPGAVAGVVHVHISGLGTEQVDCYTNGIHIASTTRVVPANFQLEVGATGIGFGAAILVDNLLIGDTP